MRALIRSSLAIPVVILLAAFAPAANATVLTWIENDNVWIANADGSGKHQLTTAGTADTPFRTPTTDDRGIVVAARDQEYFRIAQNGTVLTGNVAPMGPCSFGKPFPSPIRVDPSGEWVAYGYICNSGYPNFYNDFDVAISPAVNAYATGNQIDWSGWFFPTWFGKRLVVSDSQKIFIQPASSDPPAPAAPSFGYAWIAQPGISLTRAAVNRAGTAILLQGRTDDGNGNITSYLIFGKLPAGVPASTDGTPADVTDSCAIPTQGDGIFSDFSPDGSLITWSDDGGVKVAPTPTYNGSDQCSVSPTVIAPAGKTPALGAGTVAPSTPSTPTTPGGDTPAPPAACSACTNANVAPKPAILIGKGKLRALIGQGLIVPVRCASACSIDLSLALNRRVVARRKAKLTAAGTAKLRLKPSWATKKRLRKIRRAKATLKAVVTGPAGTKATTSRPIALR